MVLETNAQKRGRINKLREKLPFHGQGFERKLQQFSPEAATVLDKMRLVDDNVREIALGLKDRPVDIPAAVPEGDRSAMLPPEPGSEGPVPGAEPGQTLKDLLRVAQTNFNRREYMTAISFLGRFHQRMEMINHEFKQLENVVDTVHQRFLFDDVDPDHVKYLVEHLGPRFEKYKEKGTAEKLKKATIEYELSAEGGITDWWHNITTERGSALSSWESRFPQRSKAIKAQTSSILARSQALFDNLLSALKQLDSFRASRKIEDYLRTAKRWQDRFSAYHSSFLGFYNDQIKGYVKYEMDRAALKKADEDAKEQDLGAGDRPAALPEPREWGQAAPSPLPDMSEEEVMPQWDGMPPYFKVLFDRWAKATKKLANWDIYSEGEKRRIYEHLRRISEEEHRRQSDEAGSAQPGHANEEPREALVPAAPRTSKPGLPLPLSPLVDGSPMPKWKDLPADAKKEFVQWAAETKKTKEWDSYPDEVKQQIYEALRSRSEKRHKRQNVAFPPKPAIPNTPIPAPQTPIPAAPAARMVEPASVPPPHPEAVTRILTPKPQAEPEEITEVRPMPPEFRTTRAEFIAELEAMSSAHPMLQALKINEYADQIKDACPEESANLRKLAAHILKG